MGQKTKKGRYY